MLAVELAALDAAEAARRRWANTIPVHHVSFLSEDGGAGQAGACEGSSAELNPPRGRLPAEGRTGGMSVRRN